MSPLIPRKMNYTELFTEDVNMYKTLRIKDMPEEQLKLFWKILQESNVGRMTFYEYMPSTTEEFCKWAREKNKDLRFIVSHNYVIEQTKFITSEDVQKYFRAMYWLNNPLGKSIMIHFCFLKHAFAEQDAVGNYVVSGLLETKNPQGEFVLDALMGVTPCVYRHAIGYIKKLGFSILGRLPNACFFEEKQRYKDAYLSLLTRDTIKSTL